MFLPLHHGITQASARVFKLDWFNRSSLGSRTNSRELPCLRLPSRLDCFRCPAASRNIQIPTPKALIRSLPALLPSPLGFCDLCRGLIRLRPQAHPVGSPIYVALLSAGSIPSSLHSRAGVQAPINYQQSTISYQLTESQRSENMGFMERRPATGVH